MRKEIRDVNDFLTSLDLDLRCYNIKYKNRIKKT